MNFENLKVVEMLMCSNAAYYDIVKYILNTSTLIFYRLRVTKKKKYLYFNRVT